jgi:hypothetical protein
MMSKILIPNSKIRTTNSDVKICLCDLDLIMIRIPMSKIWMLPRIDQDQLEFLLRKKNSDVD